MKCYIDLCDFTQCRLIEERMRFADIMDFAKASEIIKARYEKLSSEGKLFYKYFVYAHSNTTTEEKNAIWEYLNGDKKSITAYAQYLIKKKNMI